MSTLKLKRPVTDNDLWALKLCAFFTQSVLHLNPPRGLPIEEVRKYQLAAEHVQELLIQEEA